MSTPTPKLRLVLLTGMLVAATSAVTGAMFALPAHAATSVAVLGPTVKVRPEGSVTGAGSASLLGARNEFVSFQVVVSGGSTGSSGVSVAAGTPLSGPAGSIPAANTTIYREDYYDAKQASTSFGGTGRWPDALIPSVDPVYGEGRRAFPIDKIPGGENRVAFVDILVPQNAAAGGYDGSVVVTADGAPTTVPVHLDVRDFTLPSTASLRSLFSINWNTPCQALHPGCSFSDEATAWQTNADLARLALDNRVTIADPQFQPPVNATEVAYFRQHVEPLLNGTAPTRLPGARMTTLAIDTANAAQVSAWRSLATSDGFADRAVSYTGACDEPGTSTSKWSACRSAVDMIRGAWPGLPNVVTTSSRDAAAASATDLVDVMVPVVDQMDGRTAPYLGNQRSTYDSFLAQPGKSLWLYTSCDASGCAEANETDPALRGWVDYTIDTAASQNRAMAWLEYEYGATGELYYATDLKMTSAWTDQWASGGNGDGTLFYPGTTDLIGGTHAVPLESLRLKMIRDGNQDYEYLRLATAAGHGPEALRIARALYPSTHDTVTTDAAVDSARHQLADLISAPTFTAAQIGSAVKINGWLGDLAGGGTIRLAGSNDTAAVRLRWDTQRLYAGFTVTDAVLRVNAGGRDGEVWNGDGVEVMLDRDRNRSAAPDADDYHLLVNVNGDLTDESGNGSGWDRAWTSRATRVVRRTGSGYVVELALPWASIGGAPAVGDRLGLDVAVNDSDTAGQVTPYDWAQLSRFAQPDRWGTLLLGPLPGR